VLYAVINHQMVAVAVAVADFFLGEHSGYSLFLFLTEV
jgi:hypothetical protein